MTNAEIQAEELLKNFDISIPIDPKIVCSSISSNTLRIEYHEREIQTENICGISVGNENEVHIIVNSKIQLASRRLFTAAHELGHAILHIQTGRKNKTECSIRDMKENQGKDFEAEANQFASALLLPRHLLDKKIKQNDLTWKFIQKISQQHKVSLEATARRMMHLTNDLYALIIHDKNKMWTPIKSENFPCSIPNLNFPKYLNKSSNKEMNDHSAKFEKCELSDWNLNLNRNQYNCFYSALSSDNYDRVMTLLFIEEIEEFEEDQDWEEPHF